MKIIREHWRFPTFFGDHDYKENEVFVSALFENPGVEITLCQFYSLPGLQ